MPGDRKEVQLKHDKLVEYMASRHLDAVVLTRRANFAWYTAGRLNHVVVGTDMGVASLVVTKQGATCLTNTIEGPRLADEELSAIGIDVKAYAWHDAGDAAKHWSAVLGGVKWACDARVGGMPEGGESLDGAFNRLRWTMTPGEIDRYRSLCRETAGALEAASRHAKPGMTEDQLAGAIALNLQDKGIRAPVVLIAADDRVRKYRHPIPTSRKFEKYGMAVCCGERDGLIASNTRLFSFGPIDADLGKRRGAVWHVEAETIAATRPGKTIGEVFAALQAAYAETGYADEWTLHHQGGSAGYLGREVKGTPGNDTPVLANQFFAWNPSIAGTKCEDTVLVGPDRNEILTTTGNWPTTSYEAGGNQWPRCDILEM